MFKNIFLIMMLGFATNAFATVCPAENVVEDPVLFNWTSHGNDPDNPDYYSGTLEMGEATFEFNDNTLITKTLTTRAYRQAGGNYSIPGPTIVMEPGKKYVLQFRNTLPYEEPSAEHNVFKDPNITNVHTHGVHISGESPGDDVTRFFEGGFGGDFVYDIPADHMGGSYWYHAHHHGSTYLQVSNGAFGLLLIGDGGDNIPANVAAMTEKHIVMAAGFAGGIGLSGGGCGALGAAIWIIGMRYSQENAGFNVVNARAGETIEKFVKSESLEIKIRALRIKWEDWYCWEVRGTVYFLLRAFPPLKTWRWCFSLCSCSGK